MDKNRFLAELGYILTTMDDFSGDDLIEVLNETRKLVAKHSPFKSEPVDLVLWVKKDAVGANDYNPNSVAPPEMELLKLSILQDGFTQPIVTWKTDEKIEVVDGFHRNRVGKECQEVEERIHGYLPVVGIKEDRDGKSDRIAATIRHNRARGKHKIDAMSDIVMELKNRNWKNARIAKELGMEEDEILRLCQITGLAGLFSDDDFSKSWDLEEPIQEYVPIDENLDQYGEEIQVRTVNTSDESRIFHTFDQWECHKAGFYASSKEGMSKTGCEEAYRDFLGDITGFEAALERVIVEWEKSCEHYLTNALMNRIAWLGQASMCIATGVPSKFCGGFSLLSEEKQSKANDTALIFLNKWLAGRGEAEVTLGEAMPSRQSTIY